MKQPGDIARARGMDRPALEDLPPVLDLPTAAALLGIGRTTAYQLVRADAWPTRVLRLGRQIRIPTAQLLELVGREMGRATAMASPVARVALGRFGDSRSPEG